MLQLKNIVKNYYIGAGEIPAVRGVNLNFESSEFVSVLGPSGCGKTTLLNIIGGLDRYTSGDLIIKGRSTKDFSATDWDTYRNHSIGFVFQNYNLIMHLNVLHNVELALTLSGVSAAERKNRAIEVLKRVGLSDQLNKKPSQLSGGQMQRVAIARALVNDPEILLTDEPTGALDSETSMQIMELIREIAGERLVIMVTHNPVIAKTYSTRIIKLLDGRVTSDEKNVPEQPPAAREKPAQDFTENQIAALKKKKTSMSFLTALSLSFKNLFTKKVRTVITSVAGSIGIVGIALVLSLSNGFNNYIGKMQSDTMSNYPLKIETSTQDLSVLMTGFSGTRSGKKRPNEGKIYAQSIMKLRDDAMVENNITPEYIEYVKNMPADYIRGISYGYGLDLNNYVYTDYAGAGYASMADFIKLSPALAAAGTYGGIFSLLPPDSDYLKSQYDVIYGELPKNDFEAVMVVDEYNRISDFTLMMLGFASAADVLSGKEITLDYSQITQKQFGLYYNDEIYTFEEGANKFEKTALSGIQDGGKTLRISGILRINSQTTMGSLSPGIAVSENLTYNIIQNNLGLSGSGVSQIIKFMQENPDIDPTTGGSYSGTSYASLLRSLGGNATPSSINIYPKSFTDKNSVKAYLDAWNEQSENKIKYVDNIETMLSSMNTMVDAITYVLVAFTAISLVVSSVMIGIITYVSVIERTKEIGVLRSIGARKKDISRVFNAETFIIGLIAGLLGVIVGALLNLPINLILNSLLGGVGTLAELNIIHAAFLVVISIVLTLTAGLIPSRIAAKKDPVVALRSE